MLQLQLCSAYIDECSSFKEGAGTEDGDTDGGDGNDTEEHGTHRLWWHIGGVRTSFPAGHMGRVGGAEMNRQRAGTEKKRTEKNRKEQKRKEQNRTEQNRTEQNRKPETRQVWFGLFSGSFERSVPVLSLSWQMLT
jgi:hypothetical protein